MYAIWIQSTSGDQLIQFTSGFAPFTCNWISIIIPINVNGAIVTDRK